MRPVTEAYRIDRALLADMVAAGMSTREIAKATGVSKSSVASACSKLGIELPDRLNQSLAKRCQPIPADLFVPALGPAQSWLLGLIATDGNVGDDGRLTISLSDEDGVRLAASITGMGHIRAIAPRPGTTVPMWSFTVGSRRLTDRLAVFGIGPRKTAVLGFPDPGSLSIRDFIRGIWDGDGSWGIDRRDGSLRAGFGGASESFVRQVHSLLVGVTGSTAR